MIHLKSEEDMGTLCNGSGRIAKRAVMLARTMAHPGISTKEIESSLEAYIENAGATSALKGYEGFPASVCVSVNDEVVYGIPSAGRILEDGDVASVDVAVSFGGWISECSRTFCVGEVSGRLEELRLCSHDCLKAGVKACVPGAHLGDVGHAIETCARRAGFRVVREFAGHGMGRSLHEDPSVCNFGRRGRGILIQEGMVFSIKPILCAGSASCHVLRNGWTLVTDDGLPSVQCEDLVGMTQDGPVILTRDA